MIKIVLKCRAGGDGWSETYYVLADFALQTAITYGSDLGVERKKLMAASAEITAIRVQNPDSWRVGQLVRQVDGTGPGTAGADVHRDVGPTALSLRLLTANALFQRTQWLRGVPDEWVTFGTQGNPLIVGSGIAAVQRWQKVMEGQKVSGLVSGIPMAIYVTGRHAAGDAKTITGIAIYAPTREIQITAPGLLLLATHWCTIHNVRWDPAIKLPINGPHLLYKPPVDGFPADDWVVSGAVVPAGQPFIWKGTGQVWARNTLYVLVAQAAFEFFTTHKTANPFEQRRGRRRALRR